MKQSINTVTLEGFLGSNPEVKEFAQDRSLARVSVATNEKFQNADGEWVEKTEWHNLVFWGKWASFAELNLQKGMKVHVTGKLTNRQYKTKSDETRHVTEINVSSAHVIEKQNKGE
ncbi:single-stranded DNA-binding protein [Parapedobacter sp. 10938]|uniref:single-stranded DNA-binding protein n=1 Tax=Parapedobacter flavus TaxID=3110225 RepID=UPI002DB91D82|nr:single-stranded DNA-binding protein [Parapedobacter sp. 10938]MEC3881990.1 single-stranded DNA-binding protein [Parapedobacter sp. 10938]